MDLSTDEKAQIKVSVAGTDNNNVGVGTVEQLVKKGDEAPTKMVENEANGSGIMDKENKDKLKIEPTKDPATNSNPAEGLNATEGASIQGKIVSSASQAKDVPKVDAGAAAMPPIVSGPQGVVPPGKAEGMVEGDFSLEVTPEGVGLDQPIAADKDFQPPYSGGYTIYLSFFVASGICNERMKNNLKRNQFKLFFINLITI